MEQYLIRYLKMNGKNESLLRRKKTVFKKDSAYSRKVRDPFDFKIDYSNEKSWWDCIERIAIAQSKISIKDAMGRVESVVRDDALRKEGYIYCSPEELKVALQRMRKIYLRNQKK